MLKKQTAASDLLQEFDPAAGLRLQALTPLLPAGVWPVIIGCLTEADPSEPGEREEANKAGLRLSAGLAVCKRNMIAG